MGIPLAALLVLWAAACSAQAQWVLQVDEGTGYVRSLSDGIDELVDASVSSSNSPQLHVVGGAEVQAGMPQSAAQIGPSSWMFIFRFVLPQAGLAGDVAMLVSYNISLEVLSNGTALHQSTAIYAEDPANVPVKDIALFLPRAATLTGVARRRMAARHVAGNMEDGSPNDFAVTNGTEPNGLCFVAAGAPYLDPHKITPEYPNYATAVPAVDEYVLDSQAPRLTLVADAYYFTVFHWGVFDYSNTFQCQYLCGANYSCFTAEPVEVRHFYTVIHADASLDGRMRAFYLTALAHVPPGPRWLQTISLTNYDYYSPAWEQDIAALAAAVPPSRRSQVAVCVHGWYGLVGKYTLNAAGSLQDSWQVFPSGAAYQNPATKQPMGPINVTTNVILQRIALARQAGFRVLLYFADGLNTCTGVDFFANQGILSNYKSWLWTGPDTVGRVFVMNPLDPRTPAQLHRYLAQLLAVYGPHIDGFVWDETYQLDHDQAGTVAAPGLAARAMLRLVEGLTAAVHADPSCRDCAFLTADCTRREITTAFFADGTYEDIAMNVAAMPTSVLRNYRNALLECAWADHAQYDARTDDKVVAMNVPAGIANGWGDFWGFASMPPAAQQYFVGLMANHTAAGPRLPW